jgi:hypothetical protein
MVSFHMKAGNFCSTSQVILTKCVQNIIEEEEEEEEEEEVIRTKVVKVQQTGRCIT